MSRVDNGTLDLARLEQMIDASVALFATRKPDWNAFEDSQTEGHKRAQHRVIGSGASGKSDTQAIAPGAFTLSVMYVPTGQGAAAHTHEVEEVFFMLKGHCTFFLESEDGVRVSRTLGPWDCISCPPNVLHGFVNNGVEGCYFQTMLGKGRPKEYVAGE